MFEIFRYKVKIKLGPYVEDKRSLVILGLKPMLLACSEGLLSIRVKKAMCQLCVALADHEYIDVEGGNNVIVFLVKNLVVQEGETVNFHIFNNFHVKFQFSKFHLALTFLIF